MYVHIVNMHVVNCTSSSAAKDDTNLRKNSKTCISFLSRMFLQDDETALRHQHIFAILKENLLGFVSQRECLCMYRSGLRSFWKVFVPTLLRLSERVLRSRSLTQSSLFFVEPILLPLMCNSSWIFLSRLGLSSFLHVKDWTLHNATIHFWRLQAKSSRRCQVQNYVDTRICNPRNGMILSVLSWLYTARTHEYRMFFLQSRR